MELLQLELQLIKVGEPFALPWHGPVWPEGESRLLSLLLPKLSPNFLKRLSDQVVVVRSLDRLQLDSPLKAAGGSTQLALVPL